MKLVYYKIIRPSLMGVNNLVGNEVLPGLGPLTGDEFDSVRNMLCEKFNVKLEQVVICNVMDLVEAEASNPK